MAQAKRGGCLADRRRSIYSCGQQRQLWCKVTTVAIQKCCNLTRGAGVRARPRRQSTSGTLIVKLQSHCGQPTPPKTPNFQTHVASMHARTETISKHHNYDRVGFTCLNVIQSPRTCHPNPRNNPHECCFWFSGLMQPCAVHWSDIVI